MVDAKQQEINIGAGTEAHFSAILLPVPVTLSRPRERSKYFSFYTPEFFIDLIKESPHMSEYGYSYLFADEQDKLEEVESLREAGLLP